MNTFVIAFRDIFKTVFSYIDNLESYCALMHTCQILREVGRSYAKNTSFDHRHGLQIERVSNRRGLGNFILAIGQRSQADVKPPYLYGCKKITRHRQSLWIDYKRDHHGDPILRAIGFYKDNVPKDILFITTHKDGMYKYSLKLVREWSKGIRVEDGGRMSDEEYIRNLIKRIRYHPIYIFLPMAQRQEIDTLPLMLFWESDFPIGRLSQGDTWAVPWYQFIV